MKPSTVKATRQALVDRLAAYKALGFTDVLLDFRNDSLDIMLEDLEIVASEIRPVRRPRLTASLATMNRMVSYPVNPVHPLS